MLADYQIPNIDDLNKEVFEVDGSWRDIYIFNTTFKDWDGVFGYLKSSDYDLVVSGPFKNAEPLSVKSIMEFTKDKHMILAEIILGGRVRVNCHFFHEGDIEFDLNPREIVTEGEFLLLKIFMAGIGILLCKDVHLTPENTPTDSMLIFRAKSNEFEML